MAFCNSCGAPVTEGTRFCNKCGKPIASGPVMSAPAGGPPVQPAGGGGSSALKIILIVIGVFVALIIVAVAGFALFIAHVAKNAHVTKEGDRVKVETPFGSVDTSKNPEDVAKDLGVDLYPGAQAQRNGTATVSFGNMRTVTASFTTSDPVDKVCAFYQSRFPNASVTTSEQRRCTIVSSDRKNSVTISIEASGDTTKLVIASVNKGS